MATIRQFFKNYAAASMDGDPENIASFYDDHFIVAAAEDSHCFPNNKKFQGWLKKVVDFNEKTGLEKMMVLKVNSRAIGNLLLHTSVKWGAIYHKTANKIITFKVHYILNIADDEPKTMLYSSEEDQEQLMEEKGIL